MTMGEKTEVVGIELQPRFRHILKVIAWCVIMYIMYEVGGPFSPVPELHHHYNRQVGSSRGMVCMELVASHMNPVKGWSDDATMLVEQHGKGDEGWGLIQECAQRAAANGTRLSTSATELRAAMINEQWHMNLATERAYVRLAEAHRFDNDTILRAGYRNLANLLMHAIHWLGSSIHGLCASMHLPWSWPESWSSSWTWLLPVSWSLPQPLPNRESDDVIFADLIRDLTRIQLPFTSRRPIWESCKGIETSGAESHDFAVKNWHDRTVASKNCRKAGLETPCCLYDLAEKNDRKLHASLDAFLDDWYECKKRLTSMHDAMRDDKTAWTDFDKWLRSEQEQTGVDGKTKGEGVRQQPARWQYKRTGFDNVDEARWRIRQLHDTKCNMLLHVAPKS